jgi:hypothetical protein
MFDGENLDGTRPLAPWSAAAKLPPWVRLKIELGTEALLR